MNPAVGAGAGQPVIFGHRVGRQAMAVGHSLGAVFVVHAAHGFQVQKFAGHAVDGDLTVVDFAQQTALSAAIAQGFPLLAVELAEGVALPDFFTHAFSGRRPAGCHRERFQPLTWTICRRVWTSSVRSFGFSMTWAISV